MRNTKRYVTPCLLNKQIVINEAGWWNTILPAIGRIHSQIVWILEKSLDIQNCVTEIIVYMLLAMYESQALYRRRSHIQNTYSFWLKLKRLIFHTFPRHSTQCQKTNKLLLMTFLMSRGFLRLPETFCIVVFVRSNEIITLNLYSKDTMLNEVCCIKRKSMFTYNDGNATRRNSMS